MANSKTTTLNTAGLHFISAPQPQTVTVTPAPANAQPANLVPAAPTGTQSAMVIHGNRKAGAGGGTIIETFKCEVCNQIFASMQGLQTHIAQIHETGLNRNKKQKFNSSTLHCEYKYSGLSLADSLNANMSGGAQVAAAGSVSAVTASNAPQFATAIIAAPGNTHQSAVLNTTPTFIQGKSTLRTVWKFQDFSITQILREINLCESVKSQNVLFEQFQHL